MKSRGLKWIAKGVALALAAVTAPLATARGRRAPRARRLGRAEAAARAASAARKSRVAEIDARLKALEWLRAHGDADRAGLELELDERLGALEEDCREEARLWDELLEARGGR